MPNEARPSTAPASSAPLPPVHTEVPPVAVPPPPPIEPAPPIASPAPYDEPLVPTYVRETLACLKEFSGASSAI